MDQELWKAMDEFLCSKLIHSDFALDFALDSSAQAGLPAANVTPNQGKFLYLLARMCAACNILEVGMLGGYSTIWLARALPANGKLLTLEANPNYALVAVKEHRACRASG
jgi:predicted O-methyltransferase YrrM